MANEKTSCPLLVRLSRAGRAWSGALFAGRNEVCVFRGTKGFVLGQLRGLGLLQCLSDPTLDPISNSVADGLSSDYWSVDGQHVTVPREQPSSVHFEGVGDADHERGLHSSDTLVVE